MKRSRVALLLALVGGLGMVVLWELPSSRRSERAGDAGRRFEREAVKESASERLVPARAESIEKREVRPPERASATAIVELTVLSPRGTSVLPDGADAVSWSRASRAAPLNLRDTVLRWQPAVVDISSESRCRLVGLPVETPLELRVHNPFGPEWFGAVEPLRAEEVRPVTARLEAGVVIHGRVREDSGEPVAGVLVQASFPGRKAGVIRDHWPESDITNELGEFALGPLAFGLWELAVDRRRLVDPVTRLIQAGPDGPAVELVVFHEYDLAVQLSRPPGAASGRATLVVVEGPHYSAKRATSGSLLQFAGLAAGSYRVTAHLKVKGQSHAAEAVVEVPREQTVTLDLGSLTTATLHGRIVDERARPRANLRLTLSRTRSVEATTDSHGGFTLGGLEPGSWSLTFLGVEELTLDHFWIEIQEDPTRVELVLPSRATVRGRALDVEGRPMAGVAINELDSRVMGSHLETDESGTFELCVEPGRHLLFGLHGSLRSEVRLVELEPGETVQGVDFVLVPSARIDGQLVDAHDRPVVGARITSDHLNQEFQTDEQGRFTLKSFPPGSSTLVARAMSLGAQVRQDIHVVAGQTLNVVLRLPEPEPVPFVLTLRRQGEPFLGSVRLASDDHFLDGRCIGGRLELELQRPGTWRALLSTMENEYDLRSARVLEFEAPAGGTVALDLDWEELSPPGSHAELDAWLRH